MDPTAYTPKIRMETVEGERYVFNVQLTLVISFLWLFELYYMDLFSLIFFIVSFWPIIEYVTNPYSNYNIKMHNFCPKMGSLNCINYLNFFLKRKNEIEDRKHNISVHVWKKEIIWTYMPTFYIQLQILTHDFILYLESIFV